MKDAGKRRKKPALQVPFIHSVSSDHRINVTAPRTGGHSEDKKSSAVKISTSATFLHFQLKSWSQNKAFQNVCEQKCCVFLFAMTLRVVPQLFQCQAEANKQLANLHDLKKSPPTKPWGLKTFNLILKFKPELTWAFVVCLYLTIFWIIFELKVKSTCKLGIVLLS